jgi:hypothetical protein
VFLYPGCVPTPAELGVLQMRNELLQAISDQSAGMRIVGTVEHQHRAGDSREGSGIHAGFLKANHVTPAFGVALQIDPGEGLADRATVGVEVVGQRRRPCRAFILVWHTDGQLRELLLEFLRRAFCERRLETRACPPVERAEADQRKSRNALRMLRRESARQLGAPRLSDQSRDLARDHV